MHARRDSVGFYLTVRRGQGRGLAWPIGTNPLVVGRDRSCAIMLNDPTVSRHHCQVFFDGDHPTLHDMGSRNATFLNGNPVKESVSLSPGDEIGVGATVFIVICAMEPETGSAPPPRQTHSTSALTLGGPIYANESGESLFAKGRPRSSEDLVDLFNLGRSMSQTRSLSALVSMLLETLRERITPLEAWVVLKPEGNRPPAIWPREVAAAFDRDKPLAELVRRSMEKRRGVLLPRSLKEIDRPAIQTTLVAPIVLAQEVVGAMVARSETPNRMHDEGDLESLIALAHAASPYLRAIERLEQLEIENRRLVAGLAHAGPIIGSSPVVQEAREQARQCARSRLNVLILGETGTGKELMARMIHELSDLADKPLVVVNCAAIPDELFESEVFGHERGAFTGAHASKRGLFEEANGGTLFLDEVGDLSLPNQARLLRAIETGSFRRLGGTTNVQVTVRVISATNKDLRQDIDANTFRRDLYHRLNTLEIRIPPLRDRSGDIAELAEYFLHAALQRSIPRVLRFSADALRALQRYRWPGNVRELRNVIERAVVMSRGDEILEADLALHATQIGDGEPFPTIEEMERRHIQEALRRSNNSIKDAADLLQIGRSTLYRKIAEYNLL